MRHQGIEAKEHNPGPTNRAVVRGTVIVVLPSILGVFREAPSRRLPHGWRKYHAASARNLVKTANSPLFAVTPLVARDPAAQGSVSREMRSTFTEARSVAERGDARLRRMANALIEIYIARLILHMGNGRLFDLPEVTKSGARKKDSTEALARLY